VAGEYTIDQLAHLTGITARNIRAHQSRGLLPPPALKGRTGFYGQEHVARLRLIAEMQADGFSLKLIKRVLQATPASALPAIVDFGRAWREGWEDEKPEAVSGAQLARRFGGENNPQLVRKAERAGLIRHLGDDRYEIPSPALLRAGEELVALGIPLAAGLAVEEKVIKHADGIASAFVRLFLSEVWKPFQSAGMPEREWGRINHALERLRPLALDVVSATFRQSMLRATDSAFGAALQRQARRGRRRSH
jgi:DNA-binding transcriptional MerR regulator